MTNSPRSRSVWMTMVLLVVTAMTLSCATKIEGWINPRVSNLELGDWHELTSPDFVLYSRGSREDLESFAIDLARYIAVVERLVEAEAPKTRAHLVLVDERAEELFMPSNRYVGYIDSTLNGFNSFVRGGPYDPMIRGILLHEYTHYLTLRNTRLDYPIWYREGFAEFLESIRARGDTMEVGSSPHGRLRQLARRRKREESIDLAEIFSFARRSDRPSPADLYPISWATVHFLNSNKDGQRRLVNMIDAQARGVDWKKAYSDAFSMPLSELAKKVERHAEMLSGGTPAAVLYLPLETLEVRKKWTVRKLSAAEAILVLAEIAAHAVVATGEEYRQVLAITLFRRALESHPDDSRLHAGLASALSQLGEFDEMETHLAKFQRDADPSATALVHAAYATQLFASSLATEDLEADNTRAHQNAIALYNRALKLEPGYPSALAGLGHCLVALKRFTDARHPLAKAQSLGEWDAELTLDRGQVEAATGFMDHARVFWNEVIRLGSKQQAEKAAALLLLADVNVPQ